MATKSLPADVLEYFRKQGAKGGKVGGSAGGKAAAANMTKAQRIARAKKAGEANRKDNQVAKKKKPAA